MGLFKNIGGFFKKIGGALWDGIKAAPKAIWNGIKALPGALGKVVSFGNKNLKPLISTIGTLLGPATGGASVAISQGINAGLGLGDEVKNLIENKDKKISPYDKATDILAKHLPNSKVLVENTIKNTKDLWNNRNNGINNNIRTLQEIQKV